MFKIFRKSTNIRLIRKIDQSKICVLTLTGERFGPGESWMSNGDC